MCGIAGVWASAGPPPSKERLLAMAGAIHHRGPDEFGILRGVGRGPARAACVGLAHARLSIIDLATGQQPLSNEDGSVWTVFNGEIFNYVELRDELAQKGHSFHTQSDTEVIVHAWEEWGEASFQRYNGQWAIAIWDERHERLVLARDRVGVRPLYWAEHRRPDGVRELVFGSEVKAMFAGTPALPRAIDPRGLEEVFTFWSTVPPRTVFAGVHELRPGHHLIVDAAGIREVKEWEPDYPEEGEPYGLTIEEAREELLGHLERATRLRLLRADVPVGAYLSGGLDSSVISALGRRAKAGTFRTFSLRFEDAEFDETPYQRAMVDRLASEHAEVVCRKRDIAEVFSDVIWHTERPILRTAPAPLFLLSRLVRQSDFKVVLTGEGADEMLAGYDLFREAKVRRFWSKDPSSKLRPLLFDRLYPYLARSPQQARAMAQAFWRRGIEAPDRFEFSHEPRWSGAAALQRLFSRPLRDALSDRAADPVKALGADLPSGFSRWDPLFRAQYLEVRTLLSGYLLSSQGDRMLMANSVEGRFPFLDKDVMAFCNGLPASYKLHVLDEKHLLKRAARGLVPEQILTRPKQPYRAPDAQSFVLADAPAYIADLLSEATVARAGLLDPSAVARLFAKCLANTTGGQFSNADNMAFVGALSAQLVWHHFLRPEATIAGKVIPARTDVDRT